MPRPNLIHPITVTVQRLDRTEMVMDVQAREPLHGLRSAAPAGATPSTLDLNALVPLVFAQGSILQAVTNGPLSYDFFIQVRGGGPPTPNIEVDAGSPPQIIVTVHSNNTGDDIIACINDPAQWVNAGSPRLLTATGSGIPAIGASVLDYEAMVTGGKLSDTVSLKAQIAWGDRARVDNEMGGVEEKSDGYLLCLWDDLRAVGGTFKRGDKVIQIGTGVNALAVELFITKNKPMAHWPDQGGTAMVRFYFQDRKPTQQTGDL